MPGPWQEAHRSLTAPDQMAVCSAEKDAPLDTMCRRTSDESWQAEQAAGAPALDGEASLPQRIVVGPARALFGDEFVANMRADGLIVASPTGSTAYSLSAGGPILHPGIAGWVLVPIASHTLSNRPIVLPDNVEIRITIVAGRDASANFDMQSLASLLHGDQIRVRRSAHRVRFLHPRGWSYYATLRRKLHWNAGLS